MSNIIDDYALKSKNLAPGHYAIQEAKHKIDLEYQQCRQVSNDFIKILHRKKIKTSFDVKDALILCNQICDLCGQRKLRRIEINIPQNSGAFYSRNIISFPSSYISTNVLIHELTHHFDCYKHDDRFCATMKILQDIAIDLLSP